MAPLHGPMDAYAIELQALEDYRNFSATTIQRYYRGWIVRLNQARQHDTKQRQQQAASSAALKQHQLYTAARTIQDAWRSFHNQRMYRFYRDLVRFKEAGEPRQMLRCINAREAALIDPAAGLHVRFRLGGSCFPPLVLYKIYTHRPVTDIGAFGPRNYAAEGASSSSESQTAVCNKPTTCSSNNSSSDGGRCCRQHQRFEEYELPARYREYLKPDGTTGYRSTKGWYSRTDNNGWRPVAERLLLDHEHKAAFPAPAATGAAGSSSSSGGTRIRRRQQRWRHHKKQQQQQQGMGAQGAAAATGDSQEEQGQEESSGCEDEGEVCGSSGRSSPVYHYNPLVRRCERSRKMKQRRRQWMLKMYRMGMQAAASPATQITAETTPNASSVASQLSQHNTGATSSTSKRKSRSSSDSEEQLLQLLERSILQDHVSVEAAATTASTAAAAAAQHQVDDQAHAVDCCASDWDVDELVSLGLDAGILSWTQKLDFDSYQQHWHSTAVTLGSEAVVPLSETLLLQQLAA